MAQSSGNQPHKQTILATIFAEAKWPAAGHGFQITKRLAVWYFSEVIEGAHKVQTITAMSIKNCQATLKSCIDRKSNALFTLCSESETMVCDTMIFGGWLLVMIFKSLKPAVRRPKCHFGWLGGYFELSQISKKFELAGTLIWKYISENSSHFFEI